MKYKAISGPFIMNFMFFWLNFRAEKVGWAQNRFLVKNQKKKSGKSVLNFENQKDQASKVMQNLGPK